MPDWNVIYTMSNSEHFDNETAAIVKDHIITELLLHLPSTKVISKGHYNGMRFLRFHMSNLTLGIRRHKELNAVRLFF